MPPALIHGGFMRREFEANNDTLSKPGSIPMGEIGETQPIERVAENNFVKAAEMERFMNEDVVVLIHPSAAEGAYDYVPVQLNGLNCPVLRGVNAVVKRKYVEVLARCRDTNYRQRLTDPSRLDALTMDEKTVLTYPFSVIEDKNPKGRVWLEAILKER
jgi:hypothetical protein